MWQINGNEIVSTIRKRNVEERQSTVEIFYHECFRFNTDISPDRFAIREHQYHYYHQELTKSHFFVVS